MNVENPSAGNEEGAAILEVVFIIPVLVMILAGLLDLSTYIKCSMTLDSAATAAVRYCMDDPSKADDAEAVTRYLERIEPSTKDASTSISKKEFTSESYTHLFYMDHTSEPLARDSQCSYQSVTVSMSYSGVYRTFVGKGISLALGGDGSLMAKCTKTGLMDVTDGARW